jgi:hypothetical protein
MSTSTMTRDAIHDLHRQELDRLAHLVRSYRADEDIVHRDALRVIAKILAYLLEQEEARR